MVICSVVGLSGDDVKWYCSGATVKGFELSQEVDSAINMSDINIQRFKNHYEGMRFTVLVIN